MEPDYIRFNRQLWDKKTPYHVKSTFYDVEGFLDGNEALNKIELDLLGDLSGKKVLHLQCHFGQDSLAMARKGAKVTGIDLSGEAIETAISLSAKMDLDVRFIQSNIFDLPKVLDEKFDLVYTSYGVIGWLPDLMPWGDLIANYLHPGGQFIIAEFHPIMWMFDDDIERIKYSYFNLEPIIEEIAGTYAEPQAPMKHVSYNWNHSLADVQGALLSAGLQIVDFQEYNYSPYDIFAEGIAVEHGYQVKGLEDKLPYVFSIVAKK